MTSVVLVGPTGRVGSALLEYLADDFDVVPLLRAEVKSIDDVLRRVSDRRSILLNAAGVAHLSRETEQDVLQLRRANVDLPLKLARSALEADWSFVHISSSKARLPEASAYARSKADGDCALMELSDGFEAAGLGLRIVRPPALLLPPLNAGRVGQLSVLGRIPQPLVPPLTLPVLTPNTFLDAVMQVVHDVSGDGLVAGGSIREFDRSEYGNLRDIADAHRMARRAPA